ncbi:MAG: hypothetical protein IJN67_00470 [Oscillospiraceae bacterium]|nr:hypothetical protein [Oscillospiraceae bacterium]
MSNVLANKADVLTAVFSNEAFKAEAQTLKSLDELQKLLAKYEVQLSMDEVKELCAEIAEAAKVNDNDELTEDALDNVAGGVWGYVILGVVCLGAFCLGVYNTI